MACMQAQSCLPLCNPLDYSSPGSSSMEFSRQEYWRGLPFPTLQHLPHPGIEPASLAPPALAVRFFTTAPSGKLSLEGRYCIILISVFPMFKEWIGTKSY